MRWHYYSSVSLLSPLIGLGEEALEEDARLVSDDGPPPFVQPGQLHSLRLSTSEGLRPKQVK